MGIEKIIKAVGKVQAAQGIGATATEQEVSEVSQLAAENARLMKDNYSKIASTFDNLADAVEKFGDSFGVLTNKITSLHQIPVLDLGADVLKAFYPVAGLVTKLIIGTGEALLKVQDELISLKKESINTAAAFGLSSDKISRYASQQVSELGTLQTRLLASKQEMDQYQKFLRNSAFGLRDLDTPINAWRSHATALEYVFAISKGLGMDLNSTFKEFEAATTKMGKEGATQKEMLEGTVHIYEEIHKLSRTLGGVSAPYIKQQLFQAISGQEAAITNFTTKMDSLRKAFEKFFVGLGPGEQGLAGEFLEKINKGFMNMSIGMAAWIAPRGAGEDMGHLSNALDLLMKLRSGEDEGGIIEATRGYMKSISDFVQLPADSWEHIRHTYKGNIDSIATRHAAQIGITMKTFGVQYDEAEKLLGAMATLERADATPKEISDARKEMKSILEMAQNVQGKQKNLLEKISTHLRGMFLKYMFGDTDEYKNVQNLLGDRKSFIQTGVKIGLEALKKQYKAENNGSPMSEKDIEKNVKILTDRLNEQYNSYESAALSGSEDLTVTGNSVDIIDKAYSGALSDIISPEYLPRALIPPPNDINMSKKESDIMIKVAKHTATTDNTPILSNSVNTGVDEKLSRNEGLFFASAFYTNLLTASLHNANEAKKIADSMGPILEPHDSFWKHTGAGEWMSNAKVVATIIHPKGSGGPRGVPQEVKPGYLVGMSKGKSASGSERIGVVLPSNRADGQLNIAYYFKGHIATVPLQFFINANNEDPNGYNLFFAIPNAFLTNKKVKASIGFPVEKYMGTGGSGTVGNSDLPSSTTPSNQPPPAPVSSQNSFTGTGTTIGNKQSVFPGKAVMAPDLNVSNKAVPNDSYEGHNKIRPSNLNVPNSVNTNNLAGNADNKLSSAGHLVANKKNERPNVSNNISIDSVKATVAQLVVRPSMPSGEQNDMILWG